MVLILYSLLISRFKIWSCFLEVNEFKIIDEEEYNKFSNWKNSNEDQILKDVTRTKIPENLNQDQINLYINSLGNILRAYTNNNKKLGYVQGMNMIASSILFNLYSNINKIKEVEYNAYKIFYCLLDKYDIIQIYKNNMKNIFIICDDLEKKLKKNLIEIYNKFVENKLECFVLFNSFYFSILLEFLPLDLTYLIIDLFLIYGFKIITILIILMIKVNKEKILKFKSIEEIMVYIRSDLVLEFYKNYKNYLDLLIAEIELNKL